MKNLFILTISVLIIISCANSDNDDADQRDPSEHEKVSETAQVAQDKAVAKNNDDASLVNITV